jgi:putative spermidine/putrescine transport system permease protein
VRGQRRPGTSGEWGLLLPGGIFLTLFFVLPILWIAGRSLGDPREGLLARYHMAVTAPANLEAWVNSLWFAGLSTVLAAVGGIFVGYWTSRLPPVVKRFLLSLYAIPVTLSGLVVAFGFIVLAGRNGIVNQILKLLGFPPVIDLYSWIGLLGVFPFYNVPLFALVLVPLFESLSRDLSDAARACGAPPWAVWMYVLLPNLLPGLLAGSSVIFAQMMGAFGTALAITGFARNLLALRIYSLVAESNFDLSQASALAVWLMLTTALGLWMLSRAERGVP